MPVSGLGPYDANNVFAKILRGDIPARRIYEDEWAVAFHDVAPQAATHALVIPRTPHVSLADFAVNAPAEEVAGFFRAIATVAKQLGLEQAGYRVLANMGRHSGQEVPHFHVHIFGGGPLGPMLARPPG